jgi:hypothetical protein
MPAKRFLTTSIVLPVWDRDARIRTVNYWRGRHFNMRETSHYTFEGTRGNWFGNMLSYEMAHVITKLSVVWDEAQSTLYCAFSVNTFGQYITEWNEEYWKLELELFEEFIKTGSSQDDRWKAFVNAHTKAAFRWYCGQKSAARIAEDERTW